MVVVRRRVQYPGPAQDWTDLRRTADLLGYHPAQRAAAHGWVRCTTDTGTSPSVPAGTRVQAPGTATRAAQTYEVATTTALRADWAELVVTGVPVPQVPPGSALRFLADPGFAPPDRVLFGARTAGRLHPATGGLVELADLDLRAVRRRHGDPLGRRDCDGAQARG